MSELVERWRALRPRPARTGGQVAQGVGFHRAGRVVAVRLDHGRLAASVQGARAAPFHVEVLLELLDEESWRRIGEIVAGELRLAAALLSGRWPDGLLDLLATQGLDPAGTAATLDVRCPCGDAERPCAHVVALWEAFAERIEADPFALLYLRGRGRQRFLADLSAARRARGAERTDRMRPAELTLAQWARAPVPLDDLDAPTGRDVAAVIRLLGDPPGWEGAVPAAELFSPLVDAAAAHAAALLRGEDPPPPR